MSAPAVPPPNAPSAPQAAPLPPAGTPPQPEAPAPPPASLEAESLMAAIGIRRFLEKEPSKVSAADQDKADGLTREIRRSCSRFLAEDFVFEPMPKSAALDYDWALRSLSQDFDQTRREAVAAAFRTVEPSLAMECIAMVEKFCAYLHAELPVRLDPTMAQTFNIDPSDSEVARFRRAFDVANDPLVILRDIELGILIAEQVHHVTILFPQLYEIVKQQMELGWGREIARKKSWRLSHRKDVLIQTLWGTSLIPPSLVSALQDNFTKADQKKPDAGPPQVSNKLARATQTSTSSIADGKTE